MSCTFAAPPGTPATIRSISAWLSSTSGSISGVMDSHPSGIPFAGTSTSADAPPTARASSASTGVVNRARTSVCSPAPPHPLDQLDRQERVPAQLEEVVPPPHPLHAQHLGPDLRPAPPPPRPAVPRSSAARTHRPPAPAAPCGPACRSRSAAARPAGRTPPGTMYSGSSRRRCSRSASASASPTTYATSRRSPGSSSRTTTTQSRDAGVPAQRGLDLAQLDAEAADLHLVVEPPQVLDGAVRPPPRPVARPVQPRAAVAPRTDRGRSAPRSAPARPW